MLTVRVGTSPLRSARRVPPGRLVLLSAGAGALDAAPTNSLDPSDRTTNLSGAARLLRDRNLTPAGCGARGRSTALPLALCNPTAWGLLQNRRYAWRDRQFCWDAKPIRRSALAGRSSERSAGRSRCARKNGRRGPTVGWASRPSRIVGRAMRTDDFVGVPRQSDCRAPEGAPSIGRARRNRRVSSFYL